MQTTAYVGTGDRNVQSIDTSTTILTLKQTVEHTCIFNHNKKATKLIKQMEVALLNRAQAEPSKAAASGWTSF